MHNVIINGVPYIPYIPQRDGTPFHIAVKEARIKRKETLDQVAKQVGIAKSALHTIEKGRSDMRLSTAMALAAYLGIDFNLKQHK